MQSSTKFSFNLSFYFNTIFFASSTQLSLIDFYLFTFISFHFTLFAISFHSVKNIEFHCVWGFENRECVNKNLFLSWKIFMFQLSSKFSATESWSFFDFTNYTIKTASLFLLISNSVKLFNSCPIECKFRRLHSHFDKEIMLCLYQDCEHPFCPNIPM
jgi:hypothetical protein